MKNRLTLEQLKLLVNRLENRTKHGDMQPVVTVSIGKHPNGSEYLEFEQPCYYAECNSTYYRYDAE